MIDRRTFLKLSAGALVLTAAGTLTGCGDTVIEKTSGVAKIGDVTFICAMPFPGGGLGDGIVKQLTYLTQFTIQNNSAERNDSSRMWAGHVEEWLQGKNPEHYQLQKVHALQPVQLRPQRKRHSEIGHYPYDQHQG